MNGILKFSLLFLLASVVLALFGSYVTNVFGLFSSSLNYVTTGYIGEVMTAIIGFFGWFFDMLFLSQSFVYVSTYGGFTIYSLSWVMTFARVIFGVVIFTIILNLIIER